MKLSVERVHINFGTSPHISTGTLEVIGRAVKVSVVSLSQGDWMSTWSLVQSGCRLPCGDHHQGT